MPEIPDRIGAALDVGTRRFWRVVGRPVDLGAADSWLGAPRATGSRVGSEWLSAYADGIGCTLHEGDDTGLLADMSVLDGPGFAAADLHPLVREFYEHTTRFRMEVWAQWNPLLWPGGEVVRRLFGRRVDQLALPTSPLEVAYGMDSRVIALVDDEGRQRAAGWLRTLRATGGHVYSGCYTATTLPGAGRPSVHVSFPLEEGNVQVFLRPDVEPDGSLRLTSPRGTFGSDGCYTVVRVAGRDHASRAPLHETFRVYVDSEGVLRTDHELRISGVRAVRLHYKLNRVGG